MKCAVMFLIYTAVSLPLLTISWFTWPALFTVSTILTLYYWIQESHASNMYHSTIAQTKRLDLINDELVKIGNLIKRRISGSDVTTDKIISELEKIRKAVRHEAKKSSTFAENKR